MCRFSFSVTRLVVFALAIAAGVNNARAAEPAKGLYLASADGELRLVAPWEEGAVITSPQQSPDEKWIAFDKCGVFNEAGQPDPQFGHIWVVATEGGKPKDLGPGMLPSWSPDSKQLCFSVGQGAPDGKPGMYVMNADGSGREWLFDALAGRWSPDGSRIAFFKNGDVHVYDTLTNESIQLSNSRQNVTGTPAWSADGTQIAYVHFSNADHSLSIVDSTKAMQRPRVLWEGHGIARSPSWAPSKQILVFASPGKVNDVYVLESLPGSKPERPFEGKFTFYPKDPAWAADGRSIVFIKAK